MNSLSLYSLLNRLFNLSNKKKYKKNGSTRVLVIKKNLIFVLFALCFSSSTYAYEYNFVRIPENENDINEMYHDDILSDDEYEILMRLFQEKVDVNKANKKSLQSLPSITSAIAESILEYRKDKGFSSVNDLKKIPQITQDIFASIRPFIKISKATSAKKGSTKGKVDKKAIPISSTLSINFAYTPKKASLSEDSYEETESDDISDSVEGVDTSYPKALLSIKSEFKEWLKVGIIFEEKEGISDISFDNSYLAYRVNWGKPLFLFDKAFIMAEQKNYSVILGNYEAGFGKRLTFSETSYIDPNGFYSDDEIQLGAASLPSNTYTFRAPRHLFGVATSIKDINLTKNLKLNATLLGSMYNRDLNQYDILFPERANDDSSTVVYLGDEKLYNQILPELYNEKLFGTNVNVNWNSRIGLGATFFVSNISHEDPFFFKSKQPINRSTYGAIGLDLWANFWKFDFASEYTRMDNGSNAFYSELLFSQKKLDASLKFRSYDTDFDNPHSRGFAEIDGFSKDRDRDEQGLEVSMKLKPFKWINLSLKYDQWYRQSIDMWRNKASANLSFLPLKDLKLFFEGKYTDKNLYVYGRSRSYIAQASNYDISDYYQSHYTGLSSSQDFTTETSSEGDGTKFHLLGSVNTTLVPNTDLSFSYQRVYQDSHDRYYNNSCVPYYVYQVGHNINAKAGYELPLGINIKSRILYKDDDLYGNDGYRYIVGSFGVSQQYSRFSWNIWYTASRPLLGHVDNQESICEGTSSNSTSESDYQIIMGHSIFTKFTISF